MLKAKLNFYLKKNYLNHPILYFSGSKSQLFVCILDNYTFNYNLRIKILLLGKTNHPRKYNTTRK